MTAPRDDGEAPAAPLPPGGLGWDRLLRLPAADGVRLRAAVWNRAGPRGLALVLHGRTEFLEKHALTAAWLAREGFAVASLDWRGQGLSERPLANPLKGHVGDFGEYVADLEALLSAPEIARLGPVRLAYGHSMGAAVAVGAFRRGRFGPEAMVLSAPMFRIRLRPAERAALNAFVAASRPFGLGGRWPPVPAPHRPYVSIAAFEGNLLTGDRALFDWLAGAVRRTPALALGMPTLGWIDAAWREMAAIELMTTPLPPTLCLLGGEERVVEPGAVRAFARRPGVELLELPGARHDLPIETAAVRSRIEAAVAGFLGASRPARALP